MTLSSDGARHGGLPEDMYAGMTTLENVAARGRLRSMLSVRRYAKFGSLQRGQRKLGDEPHRHASKATSRVPRQLLQALNTLCPSLNFQSEVARSCLGHFVFRPPSLP